MSIMLTGLKGKIAVITGAGRMRGIGRAIAVTLAKAGCDIVITGRGRAQELYPEDERHAGWRDIDSVAEEVRSLGRSALAVVSDTSDISAVNALLQTVIAEYNGVDILVNNAGSARGSDRVPIVDLAVDEWQRVINTNLHGTFYMSKIFAQRMVAQGRGGSIINISSLLARLMSAGSGAYAASKVAINTLSTVMAAELGSCQIRVNAICPGVIDTSRHDDIRHDELWRNVISTHVSLGRAGTGEDIAGVVAFLCSEQGAWITGQHIYVDGGYIG